MALEDKYAQDKDYKIDSEVLVCKVHVHIFRGI